MYYIYGFALFYFSQLAFFSFLCVFSYINSGTSKSSSNFREVSRSHSETLTFRIALGRCKILGQGWLSKKYLLRFPQRVNLNWIFHAMLPYAPVITSV